MHILTSLACCLVALVAAIAVLYPDYDDTLLERISLSIISIGALSVGAWIYTLNDVPFGITMTAVGGAVSAIEQGRKIRKGKSWLRSFSRWLHL